MDNTQHISPASARVRISSPSDVLAVVPYLLGFHPERSFVVIGAAGPREHVTIGFRYDLPDPPEAGAAAAIAGHALAVLGRNHATTVIGAGYGPGQLVTPVADALATAVRRRGLRLRELLRVETGRYWSYLCANVACCPADGVVFDPRAHQAAAVMTAAGYTAYPDREALAGTLAPLTGPAAAERDRAVRRACDRARRTSQLADAGRRAVRDAIHRYRRGEPVTTADEFAWLTVVLAQLPVRDDAWARMDPGHREAHLLLWTDVVRRAPRRWRAAPASLLAFTAWQCGCGSLANVALDLALAASPGYSMALLLQEVLTAGIDPSAARLPMTPEQVEASYRSA